MKNEDVTAEGKAAALLHVQILDAADGRGDLLWSYRKEEHFTPVEKTINFSCSEQQANTAATMQYWQAPRMSGFQATWPAQFVVYLCSKSILSF